MNLSFGQIRTSQNPRGNTVYNDIGIMLIQTNKICIIKTQLLVNKHKQLQPLLRDKGFRAFTRKLGWSESQLDHVSLLCWLKLKLQYKRAYQIFFSDKLDR